MASPRTNFTLCEVCGEEKEVAVYARINGRKLEEVGSACLSCGAFRQNGRGI